jgi:polysaccharide pyruvyl transferase CsaB
MTRTSPIRVVLAGWYGAANFGDEMLLATIAGWVREAGGVPVAISVHPGYTRDASGIVAVGFADLAQIVEAMIGADLFVLGGGGLFQDYDRLDDASMARFPALDATRYAQYFHLARQLGLPTVALAQGVGPLRSGASRAVAAEVFRSADRISVRDAASAELLSAIGVARSVPVAPDPAWTYPAGTASTDLAALFPALRGRKLLGINLRQWPFDPTWESEFAAAFDVPDDWASVWIDFQRAPSPDGTKLRGDEIASRMVARLAGRGVHVAFNPPRMDEALAALASCDAVVAMRYHGVLAAHCAGKPVVAVEYDSKVSALGDTLGVSGDVRIGLSEIRTRLARAISAVTGPDRLRYVVPASMVASLADSALVHRRILTDAMDRSAREQKDRPPIVPPLLSRWLEHDASLGPALARALAPRR